MEITKWDIEFANREKAKELAKQGWEPFGMEGLSVALKRPCGRLQVIEKVNGVPINQEQDRSDCVER